MIYKNFGVYTNNNYIYVPIFFFIIYKVILFILRNITIICLL